jgi:hypothetical protein
MAKMISVGGFGSEEAPARKPGSEAGGLARTRFKYRSWNFVLTRCLPGKSKKLMPARI